MSRDGLPMRLVSKGGNARVSSNDRVQRSDQYLHEFQIGSQDSGFAYSLTVIVENIKFQGQNVSRISNTIPRQIKSQLPKTLNDVRNTIVDSFNLIMPTIQGQIRIFKTVTGDDDIVGELMQVEKIKEALKKIFTIITASFEQSSYNSPNFEPSLQIHVFNENAKGEVESALVFSQRKSEVEIELVTFELNEQSDNVDQPVPVTEPIVQPATVTELAPPAEPVVQPAAQAAPPAPEAPPTEPVVQPAAQTATQLAPVTELAPPAPEAPPAALLKQHSNRTRNIAIAVTVVGATLAIVGALAIPPVAVIAMVAIAAYLLLSGGALATAAGAGVAIWKSMQPTADGEAQAAGCACS
jgi:hypothetical protein